MSAVARPTFVVVASLLANRATANSDDDDDDESDEHLSYVNCCCGPCACRNCRGGLVPERYYHESIPYFRERVSTLNERIAELHRQRATESRNWSRRRRLDRQKLLAPRKTLETPTKPPLHSAWCTWTPSERINPPLAT